MIANTNSPIAVLRPVDSNLRASSYQRLCDLINAKTGVEASRIVERIPGKAEYLRARFDQAEVSLQKLRQFASRSGFALQGDYVRLTASVSAMSARRAQRLTADLSRISGVLEAVVSLDGRVRVEFDRERICEVTLREKLKKIVGSGLEPMTPTHRGAVAFINKMEWACVFLSGITLLLSWIISNYFDAPDRIAHVLRTLPYVFGGWPIFREAVGNARAGRVGIDTLMLLAAIGAAFLGKWTEGGLLLFLFSLGNALETYAAGCARRSIDALTQLLPVTAQRIVGRHIETVRVGALVVGDCVLVKPNARLPVDGFVVKGYSNVSEACISGDSTPVAKGPVADINQAVANPGAVDASSRVYAGTANGNRGLHVYATRLSGESTLARIIEIVHEALADQCPAQRFGERLERLFTPVILFTAVSVLLYGFIVDVRMSTSVYRMLALLVAASPCALAIATPSAILAAITRAAYGGVLIKGGSPLLHLGRLRTIVFGEAGIFTERKYRIVDVETTGEPSDAESVQFATSANWIKNHIESIGIVRDGTARRAVASMPGTLDRQGATEYVWVKESEIPFALIAQIKRLETLGRKVLLVQRENRFLGVLGLVEDARPTATGAITWLRTLGIRRLHLLSCNSNQVAETIARDVGLDEARGDLTPDDKATAMKELRMEAAVAMVGNAKSDASALANATVSIAIGSAGDDFALEYADVAVTANKFRPLIFAVGLSRATSRIIRQNLWLSTVVVAILVPVALAGQSIGATVLVHEVATLFVILNALRLLAYQPPAIAGGNAISQPNQAVRAQPFV